MLLIAWNKAPALTDTSSTPTRSSYRFMARSNSMKASVGSRTPKGRSAPATFASGTSPGNTQAQVIHARTPLAYSYSRTHGHTIVTNNPKNERHVANGETLSPKTGVQDRSISGESELSRPRHQRTAGHHQQDLSSTQKRLELLSSIERLKEDVQVHVGDFLESQVSTQNLVPNFVCNYRTAHVN